MHKIFVLQYVYFMPVHVSSTCARNTYRHEIKTKVLCIKLVNYRNKYTKMHGQPNFKILEPNVAKTV